MFDLVNAAVTFAIVFSLILDIPDGAIFAAVAGIVNSLVAIFSEIERNLQDD